MNNEVLNVSWAEICDDQTFPLLRDSDIKAISGIQEAPVLAVFKRKVFCEDRRTYRAFFERGVMGSARNKNFPDVLMHSIRRSALIDFAQVCLTDFDLYYATPRGSFSYDKYSVFKYLIDRSYVKNFITTSDYQAIVRRMESAQESERSEY